MEISENKTCVWGGGVDEKWAGVSLSEGGRICDVGIGSSSQEFHFSWGQRDELKGNVK